MSPDAVASTIGRYLSWTALKMPPCGCTIRGVKSSPPVCVRTAQATFAKWLLDHPKYLQSLSLILSLSSIFEANSKKNPAFGPEFRALAESAAELTLSLLDLCEDAEAHYLISVRAHVPFTLAHPLNLASGVDRGIGRQRRRRAPAPRRQIAGLFRVRVRFGCLGWLYAGQ